MECKCPGALVVESGRNEYLIMAIDIYINWIKDRPMIQVMTKETIKFLKKISFQQTQSP